MLILSTVDLIACFFDILYSILYIFTLQCACSVICSVINLLFLQIFVEVKALPGLCFMLYVLDKNKSFMSMSTLRAMPFAAKTKVGDQQGMISLVSVYPKSVCKQYSHDLLLF